jgi:hypothetical protein
VVPRKNTLLQKFRKLRKPQKRIAMSLEITLLQFYSLMKQTPPKPSAALKKSCVMEQLTADPFI